MLRQTAIAAGVAAALSAGAAHAFTADYSTWLTASNAISGTQNFALVEIDKISNTVWDVRVTPNTSILVPDSNFGIEEFGFGLKSGVTLASDTIPSGWTLSGPGASQIDGFGKFQYDLAGTGSNRQNPLNFELTLNGAGVSSGTPFDGALSTGNKLFAAHIAAFKSMQCGDTKCDSAFFAGTGLDGRVPPVPEPSTYATLLAGLALVGVIARRRLSALV